MPVTADVLGCRPPDCPSILSGHPQDPLQLPKGIGDGHDPHHMGNLKGAECKGVQKKSRTPLELMQKIKDEEKNWIFTGANFFQEITVH